MHGETVKSSAAVCIFFAVYLARNFYRSSTAVGETAVHYIPYINVLLNVEESFITLINMTVIHNNLLNLITGCLMLL